MKSSVRPLVFVALCIVQLIQSGNAIFTRYAVTNGFEPSIFLCIRVLISLPPLFIASYWAMKRREEEAKLAPKEGSPFLLPTSSFAPTEDVPKPWWWPSKHTRSLIILGNIGISTNFLLWVYGMKLTSASISGIAGAATPVYTALIAMLLKKEHPSVLKIFGILLAFAGALITLDPNRLSFDFGIGLLLIATLLYSFFLVLQRPLLEVFPPAYVVARCFWYGGFGILGVAAYNYEYFTELASVPLIAWGSCIYAALVNTVIAYILNGYAIRHGSSLLAALFTNSQPIIIFFLASTVLGEVISQWQIIGASLIIVGVIIVTLARMRDDKFALMKEQLLKETTTALLSKDVENNGQKEPIDLTYTNLDSNEKGLKETVVAGREGA